MKLWDKFKLRMAEARYNSLVTTLKSVADSSPLMGLPLAAFMETELKPLWERTHDIRQCRKLVDGFQERFKERGERLIQLFKDSAEGLKNGTITQDAFQDRAEVIMLGFQ